FQSAYEAHNERQTWLQPISNEWPRPATRPHPSRPRRGASTRATPRPGARGGPGGGNGTASNRAPEGGVGPRPGRNPARHQAPQKTGSNYGRAATRYGSTRTRSFPSRTTPSIGPRRWNSERNSSSDRPRRGDARRVAVFRT